MGKGSYHGGSTIIGPGSGWFGTSEQPSRKKKKKSKAPPRSPGDRVSALQAARNAAAVARKDADLAAANARRAVAAADAAEQVAVEKAAKVRRMETSSTSPLPAKQHPMNPKTVTARKATPKPKKKPVKTIESEADRVARANYKKNEAETRKGIEVVRVRGARVITERKGLGGPDVPIKPARKDI